MISHQHLRIIFVLFTFHLHSTSADPFYFIVGGENATHASMPWTASLRFADLDKPFGAGHMCGAVLINNRTLLTATHCFLDNV